MNIGDLIAAAPGLMDSLRETGLGDQQIEKLGDEIGSQLKNRGSTGLTELLTGLDAQSFLEGLDVQELAGKLGVDASMVQSALQIIAPRVEAFTGDLGGLAGKLGSLTGGLFGKR